MKSLSAALLMAVGVGGIASSQSPVMLSDAQRAAVYQLQRDLVGAQLRAIAAMRDVDELGAKLKQMSDDLQAQGCVLDLEKVTCTPATESAK